MAIRNGLFEIHYGPNSKNSMIESSSIIGLGQCNTNKGHKYKLSIEKGPFAAQLSQDLATPLFPNKRYGICFQCPRIL